MYIVQGANLPCVKFNHVSYMYVVFSHFRVLQLVLTVDRMAGAVFVALVALLILNAQQQFEQVKLSDESCMYVVLGIVFAAGRRVIVVYFVHGAVEFWRVGKMIHYSRAPHIHAFSTFRAEGFQVRFQVGANPSSHHQYFFCKNKNCSREFKG